MPTVFVNGIYLYYEVQGRGEPPVIIGGLSINISECPWMIEGLASDFQVIAFDNRGAGRTDKPDTPLSCMAKAIDRRLSRWRWTCITAFRALRSRY
jgi:pimeloyl-ACP methyl ester carboxylesterase